MFAYAEAAELIGRSPCRHIRLPAIPGLHRPKLTIDGLARLADELGPDQAAMMHMALLTSGRWAGCAGLQVGGVDPLAGKLTIAFQLNRRRQLVDPKSEAGRRTMFVNSLGRPWSYSPWRRSVWLPATERAGLAGLGFHDLRRKNASTMIANKVDIKTAQTRFGHATPGLMIRL